MSQNRERIQIRPDVPITVTLAKAVPGLEVCGRNNEIDYMYTAHAESGAEAVFFLPPHAAATMDKTGARAGDTLEIRRPKHGQWTITHLIDEQPAQQAAPPRSAPRSTAQPAAQLAQQARTEEDHLTEQLAASISQHQQPTSTAAPMAKALCAAIDAWIFALRYAKERGLALTPTAEDIRCTAATIHIDQIGGRR